MVDEDKRLASERAFDKEIAENAEQIWHWQGYAGNIRWQRRANLISERISQNASKTVLEVGSGTGILTQELVNRADNHSTYISSDISLFLLSKTREKDFSAGKNLSFLINNAYGNALKNDSIDAVIGISVLHHLDVPVALQDFHRILKDNGIGVFTEPNYTNPHVFLERKVPYLRKRLHISEYETAFVRWKLRSQIEKAGFRHIEIYPFDFVYPFIKHEPSVDMLATLGRLIERIPLLREFAGSLFITFQK